MVADNGPQGLAGLGLVGLRHGFARNLAEHREQYLLVAKRCEQRVIGVRRTVASQLGGSIGYDWSDGGFIVTLRLGRARLAL